MIRRLGVISLVVAGVVTIFPAVALGHGIGGRLDLPVPVSYFVIGAGVVLVVSFVALAVLWPEPRLQEGPRSEPARLAIPRGWLLPGLGVIGLLLVIGQLLPSLFDLEQDIAEKNDLSAAEPRIFEELKARYEAWERSLPPRAWTNISPVFKK